MRVGFINKKSEFLKKNEKRKKKIKLRFLISFKKVEKVLEYKNKSQLLFPSIQKYSKCIFKS